MSTTHHRFPRAIRIRLGIWAETARAFQPEAVTGTVPVTTKEGNPSMANAMTIRKRIALGVAAALGASTLVATAVTPANAVVGQTASSIQIGAAGAARAGQTTLIPVTVNLPAGAAITDTITVVAQVTAGPMSGGVGNAASALVSGQNDTSKNLLFIANAAGAAVGTAGNGASSSASVTSGAQIQGTMVNGTGLSSNTAGFAGAATQYALLSGETTSKTFYIAIKPDLAGTYTVLVSTNATGRTFFAAGDPSVSTSITTAGEVASVAMTALNTAPVGDGSGDGVLVRVTLKDSTGAATTLGSLGGLVLSSSSANTKFYPSTSTGNTGAQVLTNSALSAGNFVNGVGYFFATDTTAAGVTAVITATGSGSVPASVTSSVSATFRALTDLGALADNTVSFVFPVTGVTTGVYQSTADKAASPAVYRVPTTATSQTFEVDAAAKVTATSYGYVTITDSSSKILGLGNSFAWRQAYGIAAAAADTTFSIAATLANGESYTIAFPAASGAILGTAVSGTGTAVTYQVTGQTAGSVSGANSLTVNPVTVLSATGATNAITARLLNQFGTAIAAAPVTVSVSGRNATTVSATLATDANGFVTYSLKDAGTTGSQDIVTFAATNAANGSSTVNYSATTVSSIAVTGGSTADTVVGTTKFNINTGTSGAGGSTVTLTATVRDAGGNLLAGVPVTFSVDKATAGITKTTTVDRTVVYSGSTGTAATTIYSWAPGLVTVTATAGGKTATGTAFFANQTSDARVVSAAVAGNKVTAKVVDRYGNNVKGVDLTASTSAGYFGAGSTVATGKTGDNGTVDFIVLGNNAAASVTVSADSTTYAQLADSAGQVGGIAVTAAVAGTSTGVGASLAPAGVATATVSVAAAAAANDVAKVQEQVTALATSVSQLVAALSAQIRSLSAQITKLAATVAKIKR